MGRKKKKIVPPIHHTCEDSNPRHLRSKLRVLPIDQSLLGDKPALSHFCFKLFCQIEFVSFEKALYFLTSISEDIISYFLAVLAYTKLY